MGPIVVVDTSVMVSALIGTKGAARQVLRACLERRCQPVIGEKLFLEYEAVVHRPTVVEASPLTAGERDTLLDAFLSLCTWVPVYYLWRPNLPDEGDNHVVELAVAAAAEVIVTQNIRDFRRTELRFPRLAVLTAADFLKRMR
ncbi:MAG: putative toxin-antitoxin system toxin component, PIN family [Verrucomicrobiales bacterium]|nr:putative toxin-antitoxin system toxin component, PIN family [Verrucomicrobiales bacterium]